MNIPKEPGRRESIFIAGPMTGIEAYNFPAFFEAEEALYDAGWFWVFNPARNGLVKDYEWSDYLRQSVRQLCKADAVLALPGFENSPGAQLELYVANELGMEIHYA